MAQIILTEEGTTPSTPSGGVWKAYFKSDGLYIIDDAGNETGPIGSEGWTSYTPTFSAGGSMTFTSVTIVAAKWRVSGRKVSFFIDAVGTTGGSAANSISATLPLASPGGSIFLPCAGNTRDATSGATLLGRGLIDYSTDTVSIGKPDGSNYGLDTGRIFRVEGFYELG
jgi:hypothetical protein